MKAFLIALITFFSLSYAHAQSSVSINISDAKVRKSLVAFPALQYVGTPAAAPNFNAVGAEIYRVINNDLQVSTYFQLMNPSSFLEDVSKTSTRPKGTDENGFSFESWRTIGAEFLIRGSYSIAGNNITMEIYTYQVSKGDLIFGKKYTSPVNQARKLAHTFSNDVLKSISGKEGPFLSRIVVASDRSGSKFKEVYVMDWDGANVEKVTDHKTISVSPAWSSDGKKIAYTSFVQRSKTKTRNADLFMYEIATGKRWLVSYRQGINSGAAFGPDNQHIFLTISQQGTPDIYKMTFDGDLVKKITAGPNGAMNVEPAISPDGSKIAFSSDRSGNPMIYIMDIDGSNPKRVTFAGKYNATPAWSPDGKRIVFSGYESSHFDIFTMNADGTDMKRITQTRKANGSWATNEDPVFSADGRLIMYTSNRTGTNQIFISNLDGSEERRITFDNHNYYKPKWSKNLD